MYTNMTNMGANGIPQPPAQPSSIVPKDPLVLGFVICCALAIIGCFLPFFSIGALGEKIDVNFVSYNGDLKDGVLIIPMLIVGIILMIKKKEVIAAILVGISLLLTGADYFDLMNKKDDLGIFSGVITIEIGFYVVVAGLIGALVCAILTIMKKKKEQPVVAPMPIYGIQNQGPATPVIPSVNYPAMQTQQMQQPAPQFSPQPQSMQQPMIQPQAYGTPGYSGQPMQTQPVVMACQYCGSPKANGPTCPHCGGTY